MERSVEEELVPWPGTCITRVSFRQTSKEDASKNKDVCFPLRAMQQIGINGNVWRSSFL